MLLTNLFASLILIGVPNLAPAGSLTESWVTHPPERSVSTSPRALAGPPANVLSPAVAAPNPTTFQATSLPSGIRITSFPEDDLLSIPVPVSAFANRGEPPVLLASSGALPPTQTLPVSPATDPFLRSGLQVEPESVVHPEFDLYHPEAILHALPGVPSPAHDVFLDPALPDPAFPDSALQDSVLQDTALHDHAFDHHAFDDHAFDDHAFDDHTLQDHALYPSAESADRLPAANPARMTAITHAGFVLEDDEEDLDPQNLLLAGDCPEPADADAQVSTSSTWEHYIHSSMQFLHQLTFRFMRTGSSLNHHASYDSTCLSLDPYHETSLELSRLLSEQHGDAEDWYLLESSLLQEPQPTYALPVEEDTELWAKHTLRSGETLSALWGTQWKLPVRTLYALLSHSEDARILNRLRVGQELEWHVDEEGELLQLRLWTRTGHGYLWTRLPNEEGFTREEVKSAREFARLLIAGEIQGSLSSSLARRHELSNSSAAAISVLLDRYLPVRERARDGDAFTLLVEEERVAGTDELLSVRLLAFDYQGRSINVSAVRHANDRFYTDEGRSLLPPFDRIPLENSARVSSHFNKARRHPVTGRVSPHNGTDFALPVGTPIIAPADGVVTAVGHGRLTGRYVRLTHGQGYATVYLHLQRTLVRQGETVTRGQRIALSGNTGLSTGPHLHYELHVNGRPVDAMRAELPATDALAGADLERFRNHSRPMFAQLRDAASNRQVAMGNRSAPAPAENRSERAP